MKIFRKFQIMFTIFLIIGFSIPLFSFLGEYIANPSIYQDRKENMKIEYENVELPKTAKEIDKKTYSKITQIWISAQYEVDMKKEQIEKYYQEELSKHGWMYEKTTKDGEMNFKKNDLLFIVVPKDNKVSTGIYYRGDGPNF
ncbi:hypothetical protein [Propionispira raffinosivorans]|uniref:hypothetical protein n=1 Tax=Propionispira raffinosivorans TaxID=86959 RepID=UPI000375A546|nr:hypothetical protein [Propionispira raffinosivorans]